MPKVSYLNSVNLKAHTVFPYLLLHVDNGQMVPRSPGFRIAHWHEDLQFTYVRRGRVQLQTLDEQLQIEQGEAVLINRRVVHRTTADDANSYTNILFPDYFLKFYPGSPVSSLVSDITENSSLAVLPLRRDQTWSRRILAHLETLLQLEKAPTELYPYEVLVHLTTIWLLLRRHAELPRPQRPSTTSLRMQQFLLWLEEHLAEDISLAALAASANVSKSECLRCFKKSLGTTPYRYLLELRLAHAVHLLKTTALSIGEISLQSGFNQVSHFGQLFRQRLGMTPLQYRKLCQKEGVNENYYYLPISLDK